MAFWVISPGALSVAAAEAGSWGGGWGSDGGGSKESTVCLCVQRTKRLTNNEHRGKRGAVLTAKVGGCSQTENVEEVVQNTLPPPSGFPKKRNA